MNKNNESKNLKIDNREYIDGVPISELMKIKVEINSVIRTTKYKIKRLIKSNGW